MIINSQVYREDNMLLLQHNQTFYNPKKMLDTFASVGFVESAGNEWFMDTNFFVSWRRGIICNFYRL
ncbi:hypothetical protein ABD07_13320 [Nitrosomonas oligotropha]|nr:hypothetical protein [Nitrosomonas oligotropha]